MSWILDEEVLAVLAAISIVAGIFAGVQALNEGRVVEPFSELGILGPGGKIGDYPKQVVAGLPFKLNVYIGNHEGKTMYYKILVKHSTNETTSIIMDLRAILSHNSSKIMPIDVILSQPGTNTRLIFEMWIFNETDFIYHNRWNQLWLNVTGSSINSSILFLSSKTEEKLVEGYLAIRRAESSSGNVTEMVNLMNKAIELAFMGNEREVEAIVDKVIKMEPEVSRLGLEAERNKLYTKIAILISIFSIGFGAFMFFRRRIWNWWAKLHENWLIKWKGGPSEGLEKFIKKSNDATVGSLVFRTEKNSYEMARTLYKLVRNGVVKLIDPNPPKNFSKFFISRYNLSFILTSLIIVLCLLSIYLSEYSIVMASIRIVLGSIFVLFIPGYTLIEALYPSEGELKPLERLALSIGLSLALVPLVGLILNYTPWGIRLNPILTSLSMLSISLMLIAAYRKFHLLRLLHE